MYIFSRTTKLGRGISGPGFLHDQMNWTFDLTDKFNEINPDVMRLWTNTMSPGNGTYIWSCWVDELAALEEQNYRLDAREDFLALAARGADYVSEAADDTVSEVLYAPADADIEPVAFLVVTRALAVPGGASRTADLGVAIAERVTAATGSPTFFTEALTGPVGTYEWIRLAATIEVLQEAQTVLRTDPELTGLVDQAASSFTGGSTTRRILRRQRRH